MGPLRTWMSNPFEWKQCKWIQFHFRLALRWLRSFSPAYDVVNLLLWCLKRPGAGSPGCLSLIWSGTNPCWLLTNWSSAAFKAKRRLPKESILWVGPFLRTVWAWQIKFLEINPWLSIIYCESDNRASPLFRAIGLGFFHKERSSLENHSFISSTPLSGLK